MICVGHWALSVREAPDASTSSAAARAGGPTAAATRTVAAPALVLGRMMSNLHAVYSQTSQLA